MAFCLIKEYADKFKEGLINGNISPDKLISMTSEERVNYLKPYVGEFNAKGANTLFESKLLLKNQQRGLITWASKLSGIKESTRATILEKINKLDSALTPTSEHAFLSDIVESRLGVRVTPAEAAKITELADKANSLFDSSKKGWEQSREYWQARQQINSYMRNITPENIPTTTLGKVKAGVASGLSVERAIKTGFDLSAALRQGRALFGTKEWNGAFRRMFDYARSQKAMDNLEVDMLSSKYAEQVIKNKSALGLTLLGEKFTAREENFGTKLIDKIPFLKGSERAFVGFLNDLRFHRFENILKNLDSSGKGITDNPKAMKDLSEVIGASTGRGTLGSAEGAAQSLATVLFSPRWIASRIEIITNPVFKTGVARTEAIKSFARLAGTSVAILYMAKAAGAKVETNPDSSDFGKLTVGNTRFDVTGGMGAYITLIARGVTGKTKSSTTGKTYELNTGKFGSQTYLDVLTSFVEGKTSPVASVIKDIAKGQQFGGQPLKVGFTKDFAEYLGSQLFQPLLSSDAISAFQDASGGVELGTAATLGSLFGVGVNTYSPKKK